jgi:hypothetical protein
MRPYGPDGHVERIGDLLVGALFLMIKDENGSLDLAELLELLFDRLLELALFYLLLGVAIRMREALLPSRRVIGEGDVGIPVPAAALPLILGNVDRDTVEVGSNQASPRKLGRAR